MKPSDRAAVPPFAVMSILNRVAQLRGQGQEIISLCAGEPSQGAPSDVRRRAAELMVDRTPLGYTETFGIKPLRHEIAAHYRRWYSLEVDEDQIALTTGSSGAFLLGFLAAFDHGDRVALTRPGYPAYRNILASLGCQVVELACGPAERFQPTVEMLEQAHAAAPLAGIVVASPANPTGTMIDRDRLAELAAWCRDHEVRLVSDEIYHGITDHTIAPSCAWEHDREAIVISSFSKYWGMTGWRLGWSLVPADLITDESYREADAAVAAFADARAIVLAAVDDLGWTGVAPADGAFYVYAGIAGQLGPYPDSESWCEALLNEHGVALTPGTDFDQRDGGTAVRVSLAAGPEAVAAALIRILRFQQSLES
jgi:aspartate/methionine/tyrosine aminotransferase